MSAEPRGSNYSIDNHTSLPARPDLIRLIIGIFGVGSSGPLIAMSAMPVPTLIFWRNLGGALMTLPFALRHKIDRTGAKWAILAGFVLAIHFVGFFLSMRLTSVTAGTAIVATQPIFAAFFVKLTGGHIPSKAWFGMFISFTGVLLVTGIDLQLDRRSFLGDLAALISGALAAAYMLIGARAQQTLETFSYTTICYFVCAATALPMVLLAGYELVDFPGREWLVLLGLILGAQILGHTMFNLTLKRVSPAVVSMIVFFEVPIAALLSFIFKIGKQPTLTIIPGVILILLGCILVVKRTRPTNAMTLE
jgi:drug/metabolite transporter (DMT)-like permease